MKTLAAIAIFLTLACGTAMAQTTTFSYQGFLKDGAAPVSGNYNISISLWDAETGGVFLSSNTFPTVPVVNGVFTVDLDFGETAFSAGAARFIEIAVKPSGSGGGYTPLTPRARIKSSPYSIQSLNSAKLGGIAANQYVTTAGGGANFIQNGTSQQTGDFNISGNGTANILSAATQFNVEGQRILSAPSTNMFVGKNAGQQNVLGESNAFFGLNAGFSNVNTSDNSFYGFAAGYSNLGTKNSFFGSNAGGGNVNGSENSFFGASAGYNNLASYNSFFGKDAGTLNSDGSQNSFFGYRAGFKNTTSGSNSFFGFASGFNNNVGVGNTFFGDSAGFDTTSGGSNVFVGVSAGSINAIGSGNTVIGNNGNLGASNLTNATAIGFRSTAAASNSLVLGAIAGVNLCGPATLCDTVKVGIGTTTPGFRLDVADRIRIKQNPANTGSNNSAGIWFFQNTPNQERAFVGMETDNSVGFFGTNGGGWGLVMNTQTGRTSVTQLGAAGATPLCRNASNEISTCSSSARYKDNINTFASGLDLIRRLRPVSFNWKEGGLLDLGLVAEEVAEVEPLLTSTNAKGDVEGVKYDRIGVVLVNAVKEQQAQIETQTAQIEAQQVVIDQLTKKVAELDDLKAYICGQKPAAQICKAKR